MEKGKHYHTIYGFWNVSLNFYLFIYALPTLPKWKQPVYSLQFSQLKLSRRSCHFRAFFMLLSPFLTLRQYFKNSNASFRSLQWNENVYKAHPSWLMREGQTQTCHTKKARFLPNTKSGQSDWHLSSLWCTHALEKIKISFRKESVKHNSKNALRHMLNVQLLYYRIKIQHLPFQSLSVTSQNTNVNKHKSKYNHE